jgi:hypothetical protein
LHTVRPNVDSNDLGFGYRIDLAAKADATLCEPCTPEVLPSRRRGPASSNAARSVFKRKPPRGFIRGGFVKKTRQIKNLESRFASIETEKALSVIQQVEVRQQVHGEIAAKRSVAVAAVTTDSGHLDRALVEMDVVALISVGG